MARMLGRTSAASQRRSAVPGALLAINRDFTQNPVTCDNALLPAVTAPGTVGLSPRAL